MTRPFLKPAQYKARARALEQAISDLHTASGQYAPDSDEHVAFQWVAGCLATQHRWLLKNHPVAQGGAITTARFHQLSQQEAALEN